MAARNDNTGSMERLTEQQARATRMQVQCPGSDGASIEDHSSTSKHEQIPQAMLVHLPHLGGPETSAQYLRRTHNIGEDVTAE